MKKPRADLAVLLLLLLSVTAMVLGCERTVEEEVVQPIESMHGQKEVASLETAVANIRTVRSALMRYPATSSENLYPDNMTVTDYDSLREVLADENLPFNIETLLWDPSFGISYISDGYTFTLEVKALSGGKMITATPNGVKVEE